MMIPDSHSPAQDDARDSPWDDLVIAILAVNNRSLERTYTLLESLREQKVTDPLLLARETADDIERALRAGGCDRGQFMTRLFAERLAALGTLIRTKGVTECEHIIGGRDAKAIEALLLPVKGIGPTVLRNFFMLREM